MQEVFSKIIEELEENQTIVFNLGGGKPKQSIDLERAIEIVKQEAEKFGTDTNVGSNGWIPCSGCADCEHKECENYGKV